MTSRGASLPLHVVLRHPVEAACLPVPQTDLETTWDGIRAELRRAVTDVTFHLWLEPLEVAARDGEVLFVRAPRHIRKLVEERYVRLIRTVAARRLGGQVAIEVVGEDWSAPEGGALGHPARPGDAAAPAIHELNPKFTFDQFVIGDGNRLAHAAALAAAEQPGQAYNPLFLYGSPGLGKTHLLHAIGNYVRRYGGGITVRYATSDEFTSGFVHAIRGDAVDAFKASFRSVDVLLLDDVQFLAQRRRTQEELFHTFDALHQTGCQLVLSSDRAPPEMTAFERRLVERFGAGLVAELEPPDREVRLAILRKRAALDGIPVVDEQTLTTIAHEVSSSVRALEGALIRVVAYASLRSEPASPELARRLLARLGGQAPSGPCRLDDVRRVTADAFGVAPEALLAHDRRPSLVLARQVAMYLARELTDESLPAIGAGFGGRNHSTVLHAHRKIDGQLERDPKTAAAVDRVRARLLSPAADRSE